MLIALLPMMAVPHPAKAAGTATLTVMQTTGSFATGSNITVAILEDSGSDNINAAQINLSYSSNLTFNNISSFPEFNIDAQSTGGGGSVKIARGANPPVSGAHYIASISFTANAGGTATVNFASGTTLLRSTDNGSEALTFNPAVYSISSPSSMTLTPATKSYNVGDSFDVAVYGDSGVDTLNAVQANLSYPTDKLDYVKAVTNQAVWPIVAENTASGGVVRIGLGTQTPVSGKQLIATVTFKAKAAGTVQIAFVTGTGMIRSTDNTAEPSVNTGAAYTINAVASSGSSSGSTSGSGTTTKPKTTSNTTTTKLTPPKSVTNAASGNATSPVTTPLDTTPPVISGIQVTNATENSATVSWTTSEPATSEVDYGLDTQYILTKSDAQLTTSHTVTLDPSQLVAHKKYHFIVASSDAAGNRAVSDDNTFSTGGIQITATEVAVGAGGAAVLGAGAWFAAAGGLKLGAGGAAAAKAAAGGLFVGSSQPIISGRNAPPSPDNMPNNVIKPEDDDPTVISPTKPGN